MAARVDISRIRPNLSYNDFKNEYQNLPEVQNDPTLLGSVQTYWSFYSSTEPPKSSTSSGQTGKVTSAVQSTVTGLLGTQDISQQSIGYQYSSLEGTQDTIFQLSTVSDKLFTIVNQSKSVGDTVMSLAGAGITSVMDGVTQILGQEVKLRNQVNAQLGVTGDLSRQVRSNIIDTLPAATAMAFGFEDVKDYATQLVENTGKMTTFGKDVLIESQSTARAFYGDLSKLGDALDSFEKVGIGAKDAIKEIDNAGKSSLKLGLNARKVVSEIGSNMDKLNTIGFKNGVEGLTRMVQKSVEFNMNIEKVKSMADKLFDPDQAIAMSAELQAIGGAIGDFNDPLKLMYMATNDAGGLQDAMIGVAGSLATYNSELGRFEITGANLRKSKALADQMGMSMEEMSKTAIKAAERSSAATALLSSGLQIDEKEKEFLTNISKMEGGRMVIDIPQSLADKMGLQDTKVALENLTPTMAKGLLENQKAFEEMSTEDIARDQYTTTQNIQKDVSALLTLAKVRVAGGLREPLAEVDKYLEQKVGKGLKATTSSEISGQGGELSKFWDEVGKNTKGTLVSSMEELQKTGILSKEALKDINKGANSSSSTVNVNHTHTVKSDGAVVDNVVRAINNSPSLANDMSQSFMPSDLDYTSNVLPSKFN